MGVKDTANLALIPAAYKASKVYSAIPTDGDGDFTFTRTGSGTRINKAGLIETVGSNVPRLNYRLDADGNPSSCPELLLEPQRINSITYSAQFDISSWVKSNCTVNANQTISLDGLNNAEKLNTNFNSQLYQVISAPNGQYTFSIFAKIGSLNSFTLALSDNAYGEVYATFDLLNESYTGGAGTAWVFNSASIEKFTNDWYRCTVTGTNTLTTTQKLPIVRGISTGYIYIWGAQLEAGDYSTSYIPTTTAPITRNKDSAYKANFADLATDYPITVAWKGRITDYNAGQFIFSINDDSSNAEYLGIAFNSTSNLYLYRRSSNNDADLFTYNTQIGDVKKIAVKFTSSTTAVVYIDGIEVYNLSSGDVVVWSFDSVLVGQQRLISDGGQRNPADELFIWNKALTDAEMVEITSYTSFTEMAMQQQYTIQ